MAQANSWNRKENSSLLDGEESKTKRFRRQRVLGNKLMIGLKSSDNELGRLKECAILRSCVLLEEKKNAKCEVSKVNIRNRRRSIKGE